MIVRSLFMSLILVCLSVNFVAPAMGDTAPIYTQRNSDLALGGYDAVAYFLVGEPTEGSAAFSTEYQGAVFQFSSQDNLDLFVAEPARYAPQYGGYCAWAAAQGKTAAGKPQHWSIVEGRLYLNYSRRIQRKWDKDRGGFIQSANDVWPDVVGTQ